MFRVRASGWTCTHFQWLRTRSMRKRRGDVGGEGRFRQRYRDAWSRVTAHRGGTGVWWETGRRGLGDDEGDVRLREEGGGW